MKNATLSGTAPRMNGIARFVEMKRNKIVEVISALFILLFLYTALSKTFEINNTVNVLAKTPGFSQFALEIAWTTVVLEYIIAGLLFIPRTRKMGYYSFLILMTVFTAYIIYMKAYALKLPCSCGGIISKMSWNQHLALNIGFIILALLGIKIIKSLPSNS